MTGDIEIAITPNQLPGLIEGAESGDLAAANTLAVYYGATGDGPEAEKWLLFAGRRGDCNALAIIYSDNLYSEMPDPQKAAEIEALARGIRCDLRNPANAPHANEHHD